jgi:hypothetical protein
LGCPPYHDHLLCAHIGVTRRVLINVQNLPVPFDQRVWGDPAYKVIGSVELYQSRFSGGPRLPYLGVCEHLTLADRREA